MRDLLASMSPQMAQQPRSNTAEQEYGNGEIRKEHQRDSIEDHGEGDQLHQDEQPEMEKLGARGIYQSVEVDSDETQE